MENNTQKTDINNVDLVTLEELVNGYNHAVLTCYVNKNYRMQKVLVLMEDKEYWKIEEMNGAVNKVLANREDICVSKTFLYSIKGKFVRKSFMRFFTLIYRTLTGFVPDTFTHDLRNVYENK